MKSSQWLILILLAAVVGTALYLGVTLSLKKAFKYTPPAADNTRYQQMIEQKRRMEDIKRRQKQLMRNQKQRIRDMQRR